MNLGRLSKGNGEPIRLTETGDESPRRQIVTLAFLAEQLPDSLISQQLAQSLCAETEASVVLVRLERHDDTAPGADGARPALFFDEECNLWSQMRRTNSGFHCLTLSVRSNPPAPSRMDWLLSKLSRHFQYVLIQTRVDERPAPWFFDLLHRSNLAYLFLRPAASDLHRIELILREARTRRGDSGVPVKPVVCLAVGEPIGSFDSDIQRVAGPAHIFVRGYSKPDGLKDSEPQTEPSGSFGADLRRLAREIGGCLVGLALSSGAAKGFAHIGVIQVLEENGIEVDVIAGSSMGAYVGALWAHGCDGRELEKLARDLETRWALWTLVDLTLLPHRGLLRGNAVKKRLMQSISHEHFADLLRPLRVVAANLATLERVVFSSGEVATAVHASSAVPGICVPITIDGETYTDGGIVDPLPVDVLREMGVARVIAVNVIPTPDRIRRGILAELESARQNGANGRKFFSRSRPVERKMNHFARGSMLEILLRSVQSGQIRMAEASCKMADVVLRPDIYDDRWLDYRHPGKFIALGRQAAEWHLQEIKSLVSRREASHESKLAPEELATSL
jgi:NTE family protein